MNLRQALTLRVLDNDPDYVLYEVRISDGEFAGATEIYGAPDFPKQFASKLRGFPANPDDSREITQGTLDPRTAGGWVKFILRCTDRSGHPVLQVELNSKEGAPPRTVVARLHVEASAIDAFVNALDEWNSAPGTLLSLPDSVEDGRE